uniref:Uncharacterized protein n=1 Tax=Salarias fasciatus TaxID=181472 RepID=A0A672IP23_SALFA
MQSENQCLPINTRVTSVPLCMQCAQVADWKTMLIIQHNGFLVFSFRGFVCIIVNVASK